MSAAGSATLRRLQDLPSPRGWPVIGNALQLRSTRAHRQFEDWARQLGPYYQLRMGPRRLLVVGDHEAVAQTLRDRPDGFGRTQRLQQIGTEMGLPPGVFGSNGESWRLQRRMVMASFDPGHVKAYFPSLAAVAQRLAARWQVAARQGRRIDLQADLMRYTVDTIAGLAFGAAVHTLDSDDDLIQHHLDRIFPALSHRMLQPIPWWRWFPGRAERELQASLQAVMTAVQGFIAQARARLAADPARRMQPQNLLEAMLVAADEPGSGVDDHLVAGNVLTMLLAGEDTTANTLAWMIDLLWRHRAALDQAVAEVRAAVPAGQVPTLEQLADLDWLEACAHETMRLKPVAPIMGLQANKDVVVGDVAVPAGTVLINLMRRDSVNDAHVPGAARFDPQRWLAGAEAGSHAAAAAARSPRRVSMPFGAGPRMCPGRYLALLEMKMAMAVLLGGFDITAVDTPDGQPPAERMSFTMNPVGLTLTLRERAA